MQVEYRLYEDMEKEPIVFWMTADRIPNEGEVIDLIYRRGKNSLMKECKVTKVYHHLQRRQDIKTLFIPKTSEHYAIHLEPID